MENLNQTSLEKLRNGIQILFPEHHKKLEKIANEMNMRPYGKAFALEKDIECIQNEIIDQIIQKVSQEFAEAGFDINSKYQINAEDGLAIQLRMEKYTKLIQAENGDIETELLLLMDSLQRLQDIDKNNLEAITATILWGSFSALTALGITYFTNLITSGETLLPAAFATVEFCTPTIIVAAVAIAVVLIIIPLIYFINKPAACIVLVINELHQDLVFKEDDCIHGKTVESTKRIPKIVLSEKQGNFYSAGFFVSQKKSGALIGTQYGFSLKQADIDKIVFNFGVGCPLSEGVNNCAVACNQSAKSIAEDAERYQKKEDSIEQDGYKISIKCNSKKGSIAYYIARVQYAKVT